MNVERKAQLDTALTQVMRTLLTQYHPEKVILFGSLASGEVEEWSDIDLLIIKETPLTFLQRGVEVALLCYTGVGVDFFVYTPTEFEQMIASQNFLSLTRSSLRERCYMSANLPKQWLDVADEDLIVARWFSKRGIRLMPAFCHNSASKNL